MSQNRPIGCLDRCFKKKRQSGDIDELLIDPRSKPLNIQATEAQALLISGLAVLSTPSDGIKKDVTNFRDPPIVRARAELNTKVTIQTPTAADRIVPPIESPLNKKADHELHLPKDVQKEKRRLKNTSKYEAKVSTYPSEQLVRRDTPPRFPTFSKATSNARLNDEPSEYTICPRVRNLPGGGDVRRESCDTADLEHYRSVFRRRLNRDTALKELIEKADEDFQVGLSNRKINGFRPNDSTNAHQPIPARRGGKEVRIAGVYRIIKRVGSGSFGEIYEGVSVIDGERVAIKLEHLSRGNPHLINECKVYCSLSNCPGIPKIKWAGIEGEFTCMVIELLGPSLEDRFQYSGKKFNLAIAAQLGVQMIERIRDLHNLTGYIHRDIKPHNFLLGIGEKKNDVSLIDFGLAKKYIDEAGNHMPYSENNSLTGTARYVSISTHLGKSQSRRDDLESIGYVLLYFVQGVLPWQGLSGDKATKYENIMKSKIKTSLDTLCSDQPEGFKQYLTICRNLDYQEKPDYAKLINLIASTHPNGSIPYPIQFEWKYGGRKRV